MSDKLIDAQGRLRVFYMMGAEYVPEAAGGLRWNNPAIAIKWPFAPVVISDRDASWPDFAP